MDNYKEKVEKIVSESEDMLTALEAIGPMYGIPATNMLEDSTVTNLKVVNDHIITPSGIKPNSKAIMCAIGAVLDHISQRVDEKINDFQNQAIEKNKLDEHIRRDANPAKGKVIGRYEDSNGDEILAYDSGLVDMANTKEAQQKVAELRNDMKIPMYNPKAMTASKTYSYFGDEDDISVEEPKPMKFDNSAVTDLSAITNESADIIDWIAHYHDTTHLGYDMLQEQGFDFVKPTDTFIQEAAKKELKSSDIKHMKFDNSHILKAIEYFNKARAEQPNVGNGKWDTRTFINSENYKRAIEELEKQFDCKITMNFVPDNEHPKNYDLFTNVWRGYKQNVHVSKSKGFQLNGLPVQITIVNNGLDKEMQNSTNIKMFGQFVCAGICHEIFHNIISALRDTRSKFNYTMTSSLALATSTNSAKTRRIIFEKFAKTMSDSGVDLNIIKRKKLVKDLCYISAVAHNERVLSVIKGKLGNVSQTNAANNEIDEYIKLMSRVNDEYSDIEQNSAKVKAKKIKYEKLYKIGTVLTYSIIGSIVGLPMMIMFGGFEDIKDPMDEINAYLKTSNKEEYYCDLFAGIYQLPSSFLIGGRNRSFTVNQVSQDKLNQIAALEKRLDEFFSSSYPSMSERNYAAMTIAKNLLEGKEKLDPALKEYCEWIVANYSNILDTDIAKNYNSVTFDPKECEDLDAHVQNLIDNNDITITESYTQQGVI